MGKCLKIDKKSIGNKQNPSIVRERDFIGIEPTATSSYKAIYEQSKNRKIRTYGISIACSFTRNGEKVKLSAEYKEVLLKAFEILLQWNLEPTHTNLKYSGKRLKGKCVALNKMESTMTFTPKILGKGTSNDTLWRLVEAQ